VSVAPAEPSVGRRAVLRAGTGLAGLVVVAALASCSEGGAPAASPSTRSPTADDVAVARARASATRLAAAAEGLAASDPELAALLGTVVADHRAHLAALGRKPPTTPTPSASRAVRPDVRGLLGAETAAAQEALDDVRAVTPGLAALLARISAARATHTDLIAAKAGLRVATVLRTSPSAPVPAPVQQSPAPLPGGPPSAGTPAGSPSAGSPSAGLAAGALSHPAREALAALTAGEHAAVYAYGTVVARVSPQERNRARDAWSWHTARRDVLEERLLAAGVQPPVAAPAYDLGTPGTVLGAGGATALAATVEDRLATLGARAVAATSGADRSGAAEALVAGARRAAAWRGRGTPLPG
jgi:hypothetical protein